MRYRANGFSILSAGGARRFPPRASWGSPQLESTAAPLPQRLAVTPGPTLSACAPAPPWASSPPTVPQSSPCPRIPRPVRCQIPSEARRGDASADADRRPRQGLARMARAGLRPPSPRRGTSISSWATQAAPSLYSGLAQRGHFRARVTRPCGLAGGRERRAEGHATDGGSSLPEPAGSRWDYC